MLSEYTPLYAGGTGTGDRIRRCLDAGLKEPKFELADGFTLTLWRAKDGDAEAKPSGKTSGIVSGITSGKMSGKIVRLINRLKADEIIGRVGPAKGGHWEILK